MWPQHRQWLQLLHNYIVASQIDLVLVAHLDAARQGVGADVARVLEQDEMQQGQACQRVAQAQAAGVREGGRVSKRAGSDYGGRGCCCLGC